MIFTITPKDFTGKKNDSEVPHTSSGQVYDLLAIASGNSELNDMYDWESDITDGAVQYVLDNYDFETAYIAHLNTQKDMGMSPKLYISQPADSDLEYGAYVALTYPDSFQEGLDEWTEETKDACRQHYDMPDTVPADLKTEIEEAVESAQDEMLREYLHGDYRDWRGVYSEASRELFRDYDVDFSQSEEQLVSNVLQVKVDDNDARIIVEEYEGVELKKTPSEKRIREAIVGTILNEARHIVEKRKVENEKRKAERERVAAYQKEQKEKKEAERIAKLQAMKRK